MKSTNASKTNRPGECCVAEKALYSLKTGIHSDIADQRPPTV